MRGRKRTVEGEYIHNGALREAVLNSGMSWTEICKNAGFVKHSRKAGGTSIADTSGLQRKLGLKPLQERDQFYFRIRYDHAVRICRAIDAWPTEVGV